MEFEGPQGHIRVRISLHRPQGFNHQLEQVWVGAGLGPKAVHQLGQILALGDSRQVFFQRGEALDYLCLGDYVHGAAVDH